MLAIVVVVLHALHGVIHGTPLDGGALDAMLPALETWVLQGGGLVRVRP